MAAGLWRYDHVDLNEPRLPDGSAVRRPVVTVGAAGSLRDYLAVIDSGSPLSVADSRLFPLLGIDIDVEVPVFTVPLAVGSGFGEVPVFEVELELRSPQDPSGDVVAWRLQLGARRGWRLPFTILFGQRGWFDRFPTMIDGSSTTVEIGSET